MGCLRCKKRRVKCEECAPCGACQRHDVPCSLDRSYRYVPEKSLSPAATSSRADTTQPVRKLEEDGTTKATTAHPPFLLLSSPKAMPADYGACWISDAELMHHYATVAYRTLSFSAHVAPTPMSEQRMRAAAFLHSPVKRQNDAAAFYSDFKDTHQNITYLPDEAKYTELNQDYFSATSWLGPACVIAPKTASDVSDAVKALVKGQIQFAIRGGGHMPIPNAANIDSSGVLVASASLNQLILDDEKETIEVGSGNKWTNVYEYLEPYKLAVVGGRAGLVGVPGFLLGGGISFFSNEYGRASANVVGFDCVLANGDIVSATAENEFSDLFWALRGGGNSFAIVTAVHLTTFSLPEVAVGEISYEKNVAEKFLDSTYNFAKFGSEDFKAGIEPRVQWIPSMGDPSYHAIIFYNGDSAAPSSLDNFTNTDNMGQASPTFRVRPSMYN
ncbi:hypothetical protein CEP53_007703 [Fusarium sp. AF-6]|nr:hypothetical protein CEP53_007703 [Fusarium sp. AF-6]